MDATLETPAGMRSSWTLPVRKVKRFALPGRNDRHWGDRLFFWLMALAGVGVLGILFLITAYLAGTAAPSIRASGWGFLFGRVWDPPQGIFGAAPFIFGTVVSSLLALSIAAPLSIGIALFLNELAPRAIARPVGFLIEMLAAIPSVVYGLWGLQVLVPWLQSNLYVTLSEKLGGYLFLFESSGTGYGLLTAGLVLAIMIVPTISSLCREVFRAIPRSNREAALALGATRWETVRLSVLWASKIGIFGAVVLGLGRALGETMAVTMVIGNVNQIAPSLLAPAQTMASLIANDYPEAQSPMQIAALAEIGLVLFAVTFLINGVARLFLWRVRGQGAR